MTWKTHFSANFSPHIGDTTSLARAQNSHSVAIGTGVSDGSVKDISKN